jgi:hypothetical protein
MSKGCALTRLHVAGPADCSLQDPFRGGVSAVARIERDVVSLSGVATVIWLKGINDFSSRSTPLPAA